ncbi:MAG: AsmA-like C-terminal region-containing protein, partial [Planctomycetota bacterium]
TGIIGDGWVHLRDTRLWSIPVMRDLLSQLGLDSSAVFERMKSRFSLADGVIRMEAIHVESPLLQLVGSGKLDLDGRLEHDLQVRFALVDRLGPVTRLWYWIQNNLLSISVRGDMSRPQIVLKGALSFLRSGNRAKRELPLPSLSPLPARF